MLTKQQRDPYIWDYTIKIEKKDGTFDYEEETKEKVKVKKIERTIKRDNRSLWH